MPNGEIDRRPDTDESCVIEGDEHFRNVRELGVRGMWIVMHPHTGEHMDVVDFDREIALRKSAGIASYEFWSAELPEEVDK